MINIPSHSESVVAAFGDRVSKEIINDLTLNK
jgi:hypothetical protein